MKAHHRNESQNPSEPPPRRSSLASRGRISISTQSPRGIRQHDRNVTAVQPIRSLSIRHGHQVPSQATLRSEDGASTPPPQREVKQKVSSTIRSTIAELQRLLNEALEENTDLATAVDNSETIPDQAQRPRNRRYSDVAPRVERIDEEGSSMALQTMRSASEAASRSQLSFDDRVESVPENRQAFPSIPKPCRITPLRQISHKAAAAPSKLSTQDDFELEILSPLPVAALREQRQPDQQQDPVAPPAAKAKSKRKTRSKTRFKVPSINPRSSSAQRRELSPEHPVSPNIPILRLNDEDMLEDGKTQQDLKMPEPSLEPHFSEMFAISSRYGSIDLADLPARTQTQKINLKRRAYVDIMNSPEGFNVHESHCHASVARNWPPSRKRFAASIACINTSCIGLLLGIYAGEVPAIQYIIADLKHYAILGNVFLYLGLAVSGFLFWPLPLLHGRKPYIVGALLLALTLQVPQGLAVSGFRSPDVATYRCILLVSRTVSGLVLGLCDMNLKATLLDLYGASLQSRNPNHEVIDPYDVRRHGGGMGVWLGIWSWCSIGSISFGFMVGAAIINQGASVSWGFWTCFIVLLLVLLVNIISPEVRRSAFRRTLAEMIGQHGEFSRVARGEIKMHLKAIGPYWWGEELCSGIELCWKMLQQPGFLVLSIYTAWVYAQFTLILMLLGALASKHYKYKPIHVGLCALSLALGALLAAPFQKASWLSRARIYPPRSDSMTINEPLGWSSHLVRRVVFTLFLPMAAVGYTGATVGPPLSIAVPCVMAALVGFLSNLAITECHALIMQTFDTSDLQPGMIGRPKKKAMVEKHAVQRTNFSCYPRVSAATAITQAFKYILAAAATGICGRVERRDGTVFTTGVVAGVLLVLTLLLTLVLFRWKTVQMIPERSDTQANGRRVYTTWEPVILGHPSGTTRKLSILEIGKQTRWSEIRRRNRLEGSLTGGFRS